MDKTRTVCQKWLVNEIDLHFLTKKVYQISIQSVNSFKSYRADKLKSTDRHIRETQFFGFKGSQNVDIWQKRG